MIELVQFPWSPFCIVQRRILEYAEAPFKTVRIPNGDRSLVWKLSKGRYYEVPLLRDGRQVLFETGPDSQVLAKYLDERFTLHLFPTRWEGVQDLLWRYIENEIEGLTFKLCDIYAAELIEKSDWLRFIRHKERKFGRGCLDQWRREQKPMVHELGRRLAFFEAMLQTRPFLLDTQPRFVDFDLFGMLGNFLYTGHYRLPARHRRLRRWHDRMSGITLAQIQRETLHP